MCFQSNVKCEEIICRGKLETTPSKKKANLGSDKSHAAIFSIPYSETGQKSAPHFQLELMPRLPQQGSADKVLVKNNFDTFATWRSKFSAVFLDFKGKFI